MLKEIFYVLALAGVAYYIKCRKEKAKVRRKFQKEDQNQKKWYDEYF